MIVQVRGFQTVLHRDSILVYFGTEPMLNKFARQLLPALTPLILVVLLTPRAVYAQGLEVISQERNLLADSFVELEFLDPDEELQEATEPGLGLFDEAVSSSASVSIDDVEIGFADAAADQDTTITSQGNVLQAGGSGGAAVSFDVFDPEFDSVAEGTGDSFFQLVFTTTQPAEFTLSAFLTAELVALMLLPNLEDGDILIGSFVELSDGKGGMIAELTVVDEVPGDGPVGESLLEQGVLDPGTYKLEVGSVATGFGFEDAIGEGLSAFGLDFLVTVPEPSRAALGSVALLCLALLYRARGPA